MDQILLKGDLPELSLSTRAEKENLMYPANGLNNSKLKKASAGTSDVLSGKTFYSGDKNLKTGTIMDVKSATSIRLDSQNDIPLFYGIDGGFHKNTDGGFRYCIWSNFGGQKVYVDGSNTWVCFSVDDWRLPSNAGWQYKINPGESVLVPKGYHDGEHRVYATSIQDILKKGTVSHFFIGSDWVQTARLQCAGTVIGITDIRGTGNTYVSQSVTFNSCPDGRGIRIRISGSTIIVEADNLVSTNTMWIDYVYI